MPPEKQFVPIDTRSHADGIELEITERTDTGKVSFRFSRLFERERGGQVEKSRFLAPHHIPAMRQMLDQLERDLPLLEDQARMRLRVRSA